MEDYKEKIDNKIQEIKETLFKYIRKEDYSLIAINLKNKENLNTWHLIDSNYIEMFENSQPILKIGGILLNANKFPYGTKIVYDFDSNKKFVISPDKVNYFKTKNIDIDKLEILAERNRISNFGESWKIHNKKLKDLFLNQIIGIKLNGEFYNSLDYREEIVIVKNKFSNKKILLSKIGRPILKKSH